jgi:hypothetical protein
MTSPYIDKIDEILRPFSTQSDSKSITLVWGSTDLIAEARESILQIIAEAEKAARIDELQNLAATHSRTYRQMVTDSSGEVYVDDSHVYISKYETQERIAALQQKEGSKDAS